MTDPSYRELGPIAYFLHFHRLGKTKVGLMSNGYGQYWTNPQVVYVRAFPIINRMAWYQKYLERVKGHEFYHCLVKSPDHEPKGSGDMMAPSVWSPTTDKHGVMDASKRWRDKVRGLSFYTGTKDP